MTGIGNAPDLVIFDVDGTLHDTFRWWGPVIRRGVAEFAQREGLDLDDPTDREAWAVVGMAGDGVWAPFLPPDQRHRWRDLRAHVLPMEIDEITRGTYYLFPGVRELLAKLRELRVKIALASNCHQEYMDAMSRGQGLGELSDWQFNLDSPGVADKTDMLRQAVASTGAERAVMVGDREPDRDAARALGLPFLWRRNDICRIEDADGTWDGDPAELLDLLGLPELS